MIGDTDIIPYREFGALRFLDFFPTAPVYEDDEVGGTITNIGPACIAGYGFTAFARRIGHSQTAAIKLDFSQDCPEREGNVLLARLGLNLVKGASVAEVFDRLGAPASDHTSPTGIRFCEFTIGEHWRYDIGCGFDKAGKLYKVGMARSDLVVK